MTQDPLCEDEDYAVLAELLAYLEDVRTVLMTGADNVVSTSDLSRRIAALKPIVARRAARRKRSP